MDKGIYNGSKVKPIYGYLRESIKFYDIDKPVLAQIIFIMELALIFGGYMLAAPYIQKVFFYFEQISNQLQGQLSLGRLNLSILNSELYTNMVDSFTMVMVILLAVKAASFFIALFFGTQYFFGLTEPSLSAGARAAVFFSRLPKLILFNILFYILFYIGVLLLVMTIGIAAFFVPVVYMISFLLPLAVMAINTLFVFKDLLIIEFDIGIFRNFKKALDLTKNNKKNIIINMLWPFSVGWLISVFAMDVNNAMLSIFIASFFEVIILFITQRLTVLMFIDAASIERKTGKNIHKV